MNKAAFLSISLLTAVGTFAALAPAVSQEASQTQEPATGKPPPLMETAYADSLGIDVGEARRRLALLTEAEEVADRLEADLKGRWGGLRVTSTRSEFRVEFLITGAAGKELAALTQRPEFVATRVSRSYQALKMKFDRLLAALKAEDIDYEIAVLPAQNVVELRHLPSPAARAVLRKFSSLIDDSVKVVEVPRLAEQSATVMGGNRLTWDMPISGGTVTTTATSGFVVNDPVGGGRGVTTAAHFGECRSQTASTCASAFTVASTCRSNGPARDNRHGVDLAFVRQAYASSQDVELRKPGSTHTLANRVRSQGYDYTVTAKINPRNWNEGTFVYCKEGTSTGYTCGTVVSNYAAFNAGMGGTFVRGTTNDPNKGMAIGGDSGGPVFTGVAGQPSQLSAAGVTVGAGGTPIGSTCGARSDHYFMTMADVESALNVTLATN
jgi:hypothetical protein